jgi:GlcNAc-P-P-Und epimerase
MVLITGGSGFIGTRLAQDLDAAGEAVRIFDKVPSARYPTLVGDVRDLGALSKACAGVSTIYHLAAEHRDDVSPRSLYQDVNVEGTRNVIAAATAQGVRSIIFTSTVAIYGLQNPAAHEEAQPAPFNDYGRSKLQAERVLMAWANEEATRHLTIVRLSVVFGEGNKGNVHNLLRQIHSGRFLMIGSGLNHKSMAYVGNVARFLRTFLEVQTGVAVLNYADKPDLTVAELVRIARRHLGKTNDTKLALPYSIGLAVGYSFDLLSALTGKSFPISSVRVRKFCAETSISTERLEHYGFQRPYSLEQGLDRMIRANFNEDESRRGGPRSRK